MKLLLSKKEMGAVAAYMDLFITTVNTIGIDAGNEDFPQEPADLVERLERFLNKEFHKGMPHESKVVNITIVPLVHTLIIDVDDEFIVDFFILYGEILVACVPAATNISKGIYQAFAVADTFQDKGDTFMTKWGLKTPVADTTYEVADEVTDEVVV